MGSSKIFRGIEQKIIDAKLKPARAKVQAAKKDQKKVMPRPVKK